jgi:hypothetical protein
MGTGDSIIIQKIETIIGLRENPGKTSHLVILSIGKKMIHNQIVKKPKNLKNLLKIRNMWWNAILKGLKENN